MNEVFETLCNVFEELRSESGEREYSVQTDEALDANRALEKQNEIFKKYLIFLQLFLSFECVWESYVF